MKVISVSPDVEAYQYALERAKLNSWWEWESGSIFVFWIWLTLFQGADRDEHKSWVTSVLTRFTKPQIQVKDEAQRYKDIVNIGKARRRYYITQGEMISLTHVFLISKVADYIRMFNNGTLSGINDALWDPHFDLPTVRNTLRATEEGKFMADRYVGEMFLNSILGKEARQYRGVDITHIMSE